MRPPEPIGDVLHGFCPPLRVPLKAHNAASVRPGCGRGRSWFAEPESQPSPIPGATEACERASLFLFLVPVQ